MYNKNNYKRRDKKRYNNRQVYGCTTCGWLDFDTTNEKKCPRCKTLLIKSYVSYYKFLEARKSYKVYK